MSDLILATQSRYKRELMQRLGLEFRVHPADIDETIAADEEPEAAARRLAREKAQAVFLQAPGSYVIGCDQVAVLDSEVLGKPGHRSGAISQLSRMQGKEHMLVTAVAVVCDAGIFEEHTRHRMVMRALLPQDVRAYVDAEKPFDCAGSYRVEGLGIRLFSSMQSHDFTGIIGLPLTAVVNLLERSGFPMRWPGGA